MKKQDIASPNMGNIYFPAVHRRSGGAARREMSQRASKDEVAEIRAEIESIKADVAQVKARR